ncbi:MAG: hypothetical protein IKO41_02910 [Lachnospiraceae bacterium]|nr:hypothetical protein [Lachnospiraceae bacterium]
MNEQEFIKTVKEDILDTENDIYIDTKLNDLKEWDSLSFVNFIVIAKELGFININLDKAKDAITVKDLFDLLK